MGLVERLLGQVCGMRPTRRLQTPLALAGGIACIAGAGATPAVAGATTVPRARGAAALPAAVTPLVAKMRTLSITSERFQATVAVRGKLPRSLAKLRGVSVKVAGEAVVSPPAAIFSTTVLNQTLSARLVNNTVYIDEPKLAAHDGGRPWIAKTITGTESALPSNPGIGTSSSTPFAGLAEEIEGATQVKDLGSATVSGQAVTQVLLKVRPATLERGELTVKERDELVRLHIHPKATIELSVNAEGLPIRTVGLISLGKIKLAIGAEVLAVNFPLAVQAPAAAETITAAQLKALEKAQKK
jgi:hypothetical protein